MKVILDIETTGLDPQTCRILEVAAIALDEQHNGVDHFHVVLACRPEQRPADVSQVVQNMHTANGLWEACTAPGLPTKLQADQALHDWLVSLGATASSVELVGRSVHFDLSFLRAQFPQTAQLLHYRVMDVGMLCRFVRDVRGVDLSHVCKSHRAMDDCNAVHTELCNLIRWMRAAPELKSEADCNI